MEREGFIFYASWMKAIKNLPRDIQGDVLTAIVEYGLYGETTDNLKPITTALLEMVKPQIDRNNIRFEMAKANGAKGGAPKGNKNNRFCKKAESTTKVQPEYNQSTTEIQPEYNLKVKDKVKDKVKVIEKDNSYELSKKKSGDQCSDKDPLPVDAPPAAEEKEKSSAKKEKEKIKFAEYVTMTNAEHQALIEKFGEQQVREMIEILDNYKGANGKRYKSDYRAILSWVVGEYAKRKQERERNKGNRNLPPGMIYRNPRQEEEILKKYGL